MKQSIWQAAREDVLFVAVIVLTAVLLVALARLGEKGTEAREVSSAKRAAIVGMFSALAFVLQILEFPLPFLAPFFYKLDFSEVPVLISGFALGPVAAVMTELLKNLLKVLLRGTSTALVGDYANFCIGCSLVIPAAIVYRRKRTRRRAILGCVLGTAVITLFGSVFNAVYLLPAFSKLYHMELREIIEMGHAIFPGIQNFSIYTFAALCVAPMNLLKGAAVSLVVMLIYKPISRLLRQI